MVSLQKTLEINEQAAAGLTDALIAFTSYVITNEGSVLKYSDTHNTACVDNLTIWRKTVPTKITEYFLSF